MSEIRKKSHIEIERNPIERFLMYVKDFLKINSRKVIYSAVFIFALFSLSLTAYLLLTKSSENDMIRLEVIIDNYSKSVRESNVGAASQNTLSGSASMSEANNKTIQELNNLISDTKFGFVHKISHYWLGNILFEEKRYNEAFNAFDTFIKKSSDGVFVPIAINKAAICLEEDGKIENAIALLSEYTAGSKNKIVMDQMYYNLGRLYLLNNNQIKARDAFKYVVEEYPQSAYAARSRERLFLISAVK